MREEKAIALGIFAIVIAMILIILGFMSIVVVNAGEVGVHKLFGEVDSNEMYEGLHFKNPLAHVEKMNTKTQEYTMSIATEEGDKVGDDSISAYTMEGLSVALDITILYRIEPSKADVIYRTIGPDYKGVIVRPQIRTAIRDVVARFEAKQLYSESRQIVSINISQQLEPELLERGIILEKVMIRHIKLPAELTNSIEQKLVAEQEAERMQFVLQKESQEAERKRIEALGIADSQEIIDESLTAEYLRWYWINNLHTHDSVIYVPITPEGVINIGD